MSKDDLPEEVLAGLRALAQVTAERELERNIEAAKQLSEDEREMAAAFKIGPAEYLRYKSISGPRRK